MGLDTENSRASLIANPGSSIETNFFSNGVVVNKSAKITFPGDNPARISPGPCKAIDAPVHSPSDRLLRNCRKKQILKLARDY